MTVDEALWCLITRDPWQDHLSLPLCTDSVTHVHMHVSQDTGAAKGEGFERTEGRVATEDAAMR